MATEIFRKSWSFRISNLISFDVYKMQPHTVEDKHYHQGTELIYVYRGSCKTHQTGKFYFYKHGVIHEVVNDSNEEMVFVCLSIPPETENNTTYL